jgi:hypothetical protein
MEQKKVKYPKILEESANHIIVAVSDTEIGKILLPSPYTWVDTETGKPVDFMNERRTLDDEIKALRFANAINDVMPEFIRKDTWQAKDGKEHEMMVMERLYILPIHHFDLPTRTLMMAEFAEKMTKLHDNYFVHGDFMRPTNYFNRGDLAWIFNNIVQTNAGLRLIDAGFGTICKKDNIKQFVSIMFREREEIGYFKEYYFS